MRFKFIVSSGRRLPQTTRPIVSARKFTATDHDHHVAGRLAIGMMAPTTPRKSGFLEEAACPAFLLFSHAFPREVPSGRISGAAPRMVRRGGRSVPQCSPRLPGNPRPLSRRRCGSDSINGSLALSIRHGNCHDGELCSLSSRFVPGIMSDRRRHGRNGIITDRDMPGDVHR